VLVVLFAAGVAITFLLVHVGGGSGLTTVTT